MRNRWEVRKPSKLDAGEDDACLFRYREYHIMAGEGSNSDIPFVHIKCSHKSLFLDLIKSKTEKKSLMTPGHSFNELFYLHTIYNVPTIYVELEFSVTRHVICDYLSINAKGYIQSEALL